MSDVTLATPRQPEILTRERGRVRTRAIAVLFWLVILGNVAAIIWLWIDAHGIDGVHDTGSLWTSIARITGLLSAYLALLQVLLLARLPGIERLAGFDRLTAWHRYNGRACVILMLAHVLFVVLGYAALDHLSLFGEIKSIYATYPEMVTATIGTGLFLAVVGTSIVIVRRRLRYEAWYCVHLLAYAAIWFAWGHQIPTGTELASNHTASAWWTGLIVSTLALVLLFRVLRPAVDAVRFRLRVTEVLPESADITSIRIAGRGLSRLNAQAGQFFLWRFLSHGGNAWEAHPFSLSEAPDGVSMRITVRGSGDFTKRIHELRVGSRVIAEGPFGVFTPDLRTRETVLLIAGGIGITPLRAMLETLDCPATLIWRIASQDDIIFEHELRDLAVSRGVDVQFVVGDHRVPGGDQLLAAPQLLERCPDIVDRDVFICGPPAMADAAAAAVRQLGVPNRQIHSERFAL